MKKILFTSFATNWRGGVHSWESLKLWQVAKDLSRLYGREVDLLAWKDMTNLNQILRDYDTLILYQDAGAGNKSQHKFFMLDILKRFVGKKLALNFHTMPEEGFTAADRKVFENYFVNPIDDKFYPFIEDGDNIVFGSTIALNLWDEGTFVKIQDHFEFNCSKLYDTATIFFDRLPYQTKRDMFQVVQNLKHRILGCHAKNKKLVLPLEYDLYESEFINQLISMRKELGIDILQAYGVTGVNLWKFCIWDWRKNIKKENKIYVPVR